MSTTEDTTTGAKAKREKSVVENDAYIAMMQRMIRSLEKRCIEDPAMMSHVLLLAQQLDEIVNVTISESADAYAVNPFRAPSMIECSALLGITKQTASKRRARGRAILAARLQAAGVASFSRARAEKAARQRAAEHAAATMPDYHVRRAMLRAV